MCDRWGGWAKQVRSIHLNIEEACPLADVMTTVSESFGGEKRSKSDSDIIQSLSKLDSYASMNIILPKFGMRKVMRRCHSMNLSQTSQFRWQY